MAIPSPTVRTYGIGTLAYLDTFAGLVPCIVVGIDGESCGRRATGEKVLTVRLTASRGPYKRGEVSREIAADVPPRDCVRRRRFGAAVNVNYLYRGE